MRTTMKFMFVVSMFSIPVMANDNATAALTADAMEQIEKEVMARLEEEVGKLSPDSKLVKAVKINAAKKKIGAQMVAGLLAAGGIVALIYWLSQDKKTASVGGAQDPNEHGNHCSCGHGHDSAASSHTVADANCALDAIRHDVQALVIQNGQDAANQLLKGSPAESHATQAPSIAQFMGCPKTADAHTTRKTKP